MIKMRKGGGEGRRFQTPSEQSIVMLSIVPQCTLPCQWYRVQEAWSSRSAMLLKRCELLEDHELQEGMENPRTSGHC